ncbi:MAG: glycosyltransferase family 4 protein [Acidobacteriota bacterium]
MAASWFGRAAAGGARGKVAVVHNGIALEPPALSRQGREEVARLGGLCEGKRVVGVVGRLREEKNQAFLIRAMAGVIAEVPGAILLVIGTGPDRAKLESLCRDVGLTDQVIWTGELAPEVVAGAYDLMEVVAVPSLQESFGFVAAEAMAHSRPVVGLKVEGLKEVVEDRETGILVERGDQKAFEEAIIHLLKDKEAAERMGRKARQRVEAQFGLPQFESGMMSFFSDALKRASRA